MEKDGDKVYPKKNSRNLKEILEIFLKVKELLLTFSKEMSGIATLTNKFVKEIEHTDAKFIRYKKNNAKSKKF